MLMVAVAAVLAGRVVPALADGDDKVHGFVTYGNGEVSGRVVDDDGKPIANAEVHVVAGAAVERVMKTDGAGKFTTSALAIWIFEWPPYYWLLEKMGQGDNAMTRLPLDARRVPCRGSGPTHSTYRDCSRPELSKAMSQPWVERPKKK